MQASVSNFPLYLQPWWWDAATGNPEEWQAVEVRSKSGQLLAYWPYLVKKRYGLPLRFASLPPFCPRSGPWLAEPPKGTTASRALNRQWEYINTLEKQLPRLPYFKAKTPYTTQYLMPLQHNGWQVKKRYSYQLPTHELSRPDVEKRFASSVRNKLRLAQKNLSIRPGVTLEELLSLMRQVYKHRKDTAVKFPEAAFSRLFEACNSRGCSVAWTVRDSSNRTSAGGWFAYDHECVYTFILASDPNNRQNGATTLLLSEAINWAIDRQLVFDFEGSHLPGVEKFYRSFGPIPKPYYLISKGILNRLF
ncbi:MAG: GNAT family N-acetyltransferase [Bacteroidota bacterium]